MISLLNCPNMLHPGLGRTKLVQYCLCLSDRFAAVKKACDEHLVKPDLNLGDTFFFLCKTIQLVGNGLCLGDIPYLTERQ